MKFDLELKLTSMDGPAFVPRAAPAPPTPGGPTLAEDEPPSAFGFGGHGFGAAASEGGADPACPGDSFGPPDLAGGPPGAVGAPFAGDPFAGPASADFVTAAKTLGAAGAVGLVLEGSGSPLDGGPICLARGDFKGAGGPVAANGGLGAPAGGPRGFGFGSSSFTTGSDSLLAKWGLGVLGLAPGPSGSFGGMAGPLRAGFGGPTAPGGPGLGRAAFPGGGPLPCRATLALGGFATPSPLA